jgi:hypothetical protein
MFQILFDALNSKNTHVNIMPKPNIYDYNNLQLWHKFIHIGMWTILSYLVHYV